MLCARGQFILKLLPKGIEQWCDRQICQHGKDKARRLHVELDDASVWSSESFDSYTKKKNLIWLNAFFFDYSKCFFRLTSCATSWNKIRSSVTATMRLDFRKELYSCKPIKFTNKPLARLGANRFRRGLAQTCPHPPMMNLISLGGPQQGVNQYPRCEQTLGRASCELLKFKLNLKAYR